MIKQKPNLPLDRVIQFEIQPLREVRRDIWLNRKHIGLMLVIILVAMLVSTVVAAFLPAGSFIAISQVGTEVKQISTALSLPDALYFTVVNMTTVGFGDIIPANAAARSLAIVNSIFGLITFAGLVSVITVAFSPKNESSVGGGVGTLVLTEEAKPDLPAPQIHIGFWRRHLMVQIKHARSYIGRAQDYDSEYARRARKAAPGEGERKEVHADHMEFMRTALSEANESLRRLELIVQFADETE